MFAFVNIERRAQLRVAQWLMRRYSRQIENLKATGVYDVRVLRHLEECITHFQHIEQRILRELKQRGGDATVNDQLDDDEELNRAP